MNSMHKKCFRAISAAFVLCSFFAVSFLAASAEANYPEKTIQMVVPYKPGGDTDANARILAKYLSEELGKPVVIVNVNGAGGSVAARKVKAANPDGYTVLFWHNVLLLDEITGVTDFSYDAYDVAGISSFSDVGVWLVNSKSKYQTLQDLIDEAKARPNEVKMAISVGSYVHFQALAVEEETGVEFNKVDCGGGADKTAALLAGRIDVTSLQYGVIKDYITSGKFRVLGAIAPKRSAFMPDVPTFKEQGVDISFEKFYFTAFPKGTPVEIRETFANAVRTVVTENQECREAYEKMTFVPGFLGSADAVEYIKTQDAYYQQFKEAMLKEKI